MKKYITGMFLMLILGSFTGCGKEQQEVPKLLEPVGVKLDTAVAGRGDIYEIAVYSGEVVPYVEEVCFTTDGKLGEWKVSIGDTVEAGQMLAVLEDEEILKEIEALEKQMEETITLGDFSDRSAQADIEIARYEWCILKDYRYPEEECNAKAVEIEMLEADLRQAQELRSLELDRLDTLLAEQKENLKCITVTAPIGGQVVYIAPQKSRGFCQCL